MTKRIASVVRIMRDLNLLTWRSIQLGWERHWLTGKDVSEFAAESLADYSGPCSETIAMLAWAETLEDKDIRGHLADVVGSMVKNKAELPAIDKWRLAYMIELSERSMDEKSRLDEIQELYSDFDCSEDMDRCSMYYVDPSKQPPNVGDHCDSPLDSFRQTIESLKARHSCSN